MDLPLQRSIGTVYTNKMSGSITFFIQRNENRRDDVITINPESHGIYEVTFKSEDEPHIGTRTMMLTENDTLRYIQTTFDLICNDHEPFPFVQFTSPNAPSVIFKTEQLLEQSLRTNIFNSIKMTMRNWPVSTTYRPRRNTLVSETPNRPTISVNTEPIRRQSAIRSHLSFE